MGRFGFWKNPNLFFQSSLEDDPEEQPHQQEQGRRTRDVRPFGTSVDYGSIQQQHEHEHQDSALDIQQQTLVGDEPIEMVNTTSPMLPRPQRRRMSRSTSGSDDDGSSSITTTTTTTTQSQQELPSLTAAFRSIENRSIVFNCVIYLILYMTMAVVAYSFVLERWTIIDSLYFAVATL